MTAFKTHEPQRRKDAEETQEKATSVRMAHRIDRSQMCGRGASTESVSVTLAFPLRLCAFAVIEQYAV